MIVRVYILFRIFDKNAKINKNFIHSTKNSTISNVFCENEKKTTTKKSVMRLNFPLFCTFIKMIGSIYSFAFLTKMQKQIKISFTLPKKAHFPTFLAKMRKKIQKNRS